MSNSIYEKNVRCLSQKNREMLSDLDVSDQSVSDAGYYASVKTSKSGLLIPCFADGMASNSTYDPIREAVQIVQTLKANSFIFFAGIGGGFHIREFLRKAPHARCVIAESNIHSFRSLLSLVDLSDIFLDSRVSVFPDCASNTLVTEFPLTYFPALNGDFTLYSLRTWEDRNKRELSILESHIKKALSTISADYSVQSHFGKIWLRNAFINLGIASEAGCFIPSEDTDKIAVVAAAGPSLEAALPDIKAHRSQYTIFSTDTAFGTLTASGIIPDYFISIDAQSVSSSHAMKGFTHEMNIVVDICGNPDIALQARKCDSNLIFVAGGHPLAGLASATGRIPRIDTSSGTVTVAALDAAHALGFSNVKIAGADFAYTGGKPYARGTYLEDIYGRKMDRLTPMEHLYTSLMFRTPVDMHTILSKITYSNTILNGYSRACREYKSINKWEAGAIPPFPFKAFLGQYLADLRKAAGNETDNREAVNTLLPFFAWYRGMVSRRGFQWELSSAFQLAFDLIARYTKIS